MYIIVWQCFFVYNLSIHKTLKQVDCLLTSVKRAVASVPEKQVRVELRIREGIKNWHFEDLVLNEGGGPGVLIFCVFLVTNDYNDYNDYNDCNNYNGYRDSDLDLNWELQ